MKEIISLNNSISISISILNYKQNQKQIENKEEKKKRKRNEIEQQQQEKQEEIEGRKVEEENEGEGRVREEEKQQQEIEEKITSKQQQQQQQQNNENKKYELIIRHDSVVNYFRSLFREELYCVMCGKYNNKECEIPNQNKDICNVCDSLIWKVEKLNIVVKFCKGCKNFCHIDTFGEKPLAAKCAKCRQRGRLHYHTKKNLDHSIINSPSSSSRLTMQTPILSTYILPEQRNLYLSPPPSDLSSSHIGRSISPVDPISSLLTKKKKDYPEISSPISNSLITLTQSPLLSQSPIYPNRNDLYLDENKNEDFVNLPTIPSYYPYHYNNSTNSLTNIPNNFLLNTDGDEKSSVSGNNVWNPSLHPLFNLAVLSEQILLPGPPISPPLPTNSNISDTQIQSSTCIQNNGYNDHNDQNNVTINNNLV